MKILVVDEEGTVIETYQDREFSSLEDLVSVLIRDIELLVFQEKLDPTYTEEED